MGAVKFYIAALTTALAADYTFEDWVRGLFEGLD
jgi:hypothetical protein